MLKWIAGLAALLALVPGLALGQARFTNPDGSTSPSMVMEYKTGAGTADAVSSSAPLPMTCISGCGSTSALTYSGAASATVGTSSATLITAGAYTRALQICTLRTSTTNVWLRADGTAVVAGTGIPVWAGGGCVSFGGPGMPIPSALITAITDSGSPQVVTLAGG